uniref:Uncharacterized protein n=1 Tax=uncultured prokaryote TaxID=198431 RepID=A0A0H5QEB8_9ZZZZ|nr:hypothetical protein [uncultured prokaryote]
MGAPSGHPRAPLRPAAPLPWDRGGGPGASRGCAPGPPVGPSAPRWGWGAGGRCGWLGSLRPLGGACGPLGLSAGRPPRRRGPGAPPAGPAPAWPGPGVGGPASPPPRSPGRGVVGAPCAGLRVAPVGLGPPLPVSVRPAPLPAPRRVPLPGALSGGPAIAMGRRAFLPPGAAGGGASAALCSAAAPSVGGGYQTRRGAVKGPARRPGAAPDIPPPGPMLGQ